MLISDREGKWEENVYKCRFHYFFKHGSMDILSSSLVLRKDGLWDGRATWALAPLFHLYWFSGPSLLWTLDPNICSGAPTFLCTVFLTFVKSQI